MRDVCKSYPFLMSHGEMILQIIGALVWIYALKGIIFSCWGRLSYHTRFEKEIESKGISHIP